MRKFLLAVAAVALAAVGFTAVDTAVEPEPAGAQTIDKAVYCYHYGPDQFGEQPFFGARVTLRGGTPLPTSIFKIDKIQLTPSWPGSYDNGDHSPWRVLVRSGGNESNLYLGDMAGAWDGKVNIGFSTIFNQTLNPYTTKIRMQFKVEKDGIYRNAIYVECTRRVHDVDPS